MRLAINCPGCGGQIHLVGTFYTSPRPAETRIDVHPSAFSRRAHARCFAGPPHNGGEEVLAA